jgi:hypothetical protein
VTEDARADAVWRQYDRWEYPPPVTDLEAWPMAIGISSTFLDPSDLLAEPGIHTGPCVIITSDAYIAAPRLVKPLATVRKRVTPTLV